MCFCQAHPENAGIAQLVEHNLAKVRVASSSLVSRSKGCPGGGMVDTLDLKSNGHYGRAGSSPALGTLGNGAMNFLVAPFFAGIAQLVEHNLAKVRVASSSLVSRSRPPNLRRLFFLQFYRSWINSFPRIFRLCKVNSVIIMNAPPLFFTSL